MNNRRDSEPGPELSPLLRLARKQLSGDAPRRGAATFSTVEQALAARAARRFAPRLWLVASAALCAACLAWLVLREPVLQYEVVNGSLTASHHVNGASQGTEVRFSDGTELALGAEARTEIARVTAAGADVALERGKLRVSVAKRKGADWSIRALGYVVKVTGTEFDVALDAGALRVEMFSGSVIVRGPLIESGLRVSAGQSLLLKPGEQLVRVQRRELEEANAAAPTPARSSARAEPVAAEDLAEAPPDASATTTVTSATTPEVPAPRAARARAAGSKSIATPRETWSRELAAGRFREVIADAERRSLARVYAEANAEELQALADAARYARRADIARPALLAVRQRFQGSLAAEDAAFFLGRLEENRGSANDALAWYGRYLDESTRGTYAPQALGAKLLLLRGSGASAAARECAKEYLERYPRGPLADTARRLAR